MLEVLVLHFGYCQFKNSFMLTIKNFSMLTIIRVCVITGR